MDNPNGHVNWYAVLETKRLLLRPNTNATWITTHQIETFITPYMYTLFATSTEHIDRYASTCAHSQTMRARTMRAYANARICSHCTRSHRLRTHFSCVMRAFAYVIWASSVSVMRAYARIRMRCEHIHIACARIRIACACIACECAHLRGTYACPVLYGCDVRSRGRKSYHNLHIDYVALLWLFSPCCDYSSATDKSA